MSTRIKFKTVTGDDLAAKKAKTINGFDKIIIWLDHSEFPGSLEHLKKHCTDIKPYLEQMPYQAQWKCRIEILQPTKNCLGLLATALGNNISVMVAYVEIAVDFPAESKEQALLWRDAFLMAGCMKYQRKLVVLDNTGNTGNTWYYGRRVNEDGNKRGKVLAVYADKPSKILNAPKPVNGTPPCLHVELRATGYSVISGLGIVTIQDLIEFKHKRFWSEHIHLFELPKPTELGRLISNVNEADLNVSTTAIRKRGKSWMSQNSIRGKFVMHNALLGRPNIVKKLQKISFGDWVKKLIW